MLTPMATALVVVIGRIAMEANAVVAGDAVAADVAVAAEAKAAIAKAHRRVEPLLALALRPPDRKIRLLRKPRPCHRVTVLTTTRTPGISSIKRLARGSRTTGNNGQRNRITRRRSPSTGSPQNM